MGVVIRRNIDILIIIINFPTPLVLGLFLAAASLLLCSFLKCFFGLKYIPCSRVLYQLVYYSHTILYQL